MSEFNVQSAASKIASALGNGWRAAPGVQSGDCDAYLRGPDGEEIHLHANTWRQADSNRLFLSGSFSYDLYQHRPYKSPKHEITVSQAKSPVQIARDIERRLLPGYRETLAAARESKYRSEEQAAARELLGAELAAVLGADIRRDYQTEELLDLRIGGYGDGGVNGDLEIPSGDYNVTIKIHVPKSRAVEFATLLAKFREG